MRIIMPATSEKAKDSPGRGLNRRFDVPQVKGVNMGQAAVDLPDPLETPPVSASSTDDLLAQLAGEEIERLLSEEESAPAGEPVGKPHPPVQVPAQTSKVEPVAAPAVAAKEAPADTDLNALFSQLDPTEGKSQTPVRAKSEPVASTPDAAPSVAEELAWEIDEDSALMSSGQAASAAVGPVSTAAAREPLVLRLLAWLNSPLDAFPDRVRDAVGKIAILTTVNALSVLVYLLLFRRH
jgi:hypothetical protein